MLQFFLSNYNEEDNQIHTFSKRTSVKWTYKASTAIWTKHTDSIFPADNHHATQNSMWSLISFRIQLRSE